MIRTRFAPSPTGPLHLGHAYSAIIAHDFAQHYGGEFIVRIEDLDQSRARKTWEDQIFEDLQWLGLTWENPVMRQSNRTNAYEAALQHLWDRSLLYPCFCTRADIAAAVGAPQEGESSHFGPDGLIYPGTCRGKCKPKEIPAQALRLDMTVILKNLEQSAALGYFEIGPEGQDTPEKHNIDPAHAVKNIGDIVVLRRDMAAAYHLAVVIDDAAQGITHVVRGHDLQEATDIHVILQNCLKLPTPIYFHHKLIRDEQGKRLAKRDDSKSIAKFRSEGATPQDIRALLGL